MRQWKKRLALFLAAVMLLGAMPAAALEEAQGETASVEQTQDETASAEENQNETASAEENQNETTSAEENQNETTSAEENQNETTSAEENQNETTSAEGNQNGTTSAEGNQNGTASAEGNQNGTASAEGNQDGTASALTQTDVPDNTRPKGLEDVVVYNLLNYETVVLPALPENDEGWDALNVLLEENGWKEYAAFDAGGHYTIPLPGETIFFPYEIQFQYQGETWTEWFKTEESTVNVGEYSFSLDTQGAETLYIQGGEDEVRSYLQKDFTTDGDQAMLLSLQKLTTLSPTVYLEPMRLEENGVFSLRELLDLAKTVYTGYEDVTISDDSVIVWKSYYGSSEKNEDRYQIGSGSTEVDVAALMMEHGRYNDWAYIECIIGKDGVGSKYQNDAEKYRWELDLYRQDGFLYLRACDTEGVYISNSVSYTNSDFYDQNGNQLKKYYQNLQMYASRWSGAETAYLKFAPSSALNRILTQAGEGASVKIYEGYYETVEALTAAKADEVTDRLLAASSSDGDMANIPGYEAAPLPELWDWYDWEKIPKFTLVLMDADGAIDRVLLPFGVQLYRSTASISQPNALYAQRSSGSSNYFEDVSRRRSMTRPDRDTVCYTHFITESLYPLDGSYYYQMRLQDPEGKDIMTYVSGVTVNGKALTESEIRQLFSTSTQGGYYARYDGDGVTFVLTYTDKYEYNNRNTETVIIKVAAYEDPVQEPSVDEYDTFFRISGAMARQDGYTGSCRSYVIREKDDGYFRYGYQTVLLTNYDDSAVNSEKIVPYFSHTAKTVQAKTFKNTSASAQVSGETEIDFTPGIPVQYTAYTEDTSSAHRNYWVTFVTKTSGGPDLFINGATNADEGHKDGEDITRLVVLDDAKAYHDVFVANVGDAAIKGLYAKLENEQNVKLDEYWTFDGSKDDRNTLAAFPTSAIDSYYGLPNIAKVRLLPIVDEATGRISGGTVSGTLVIGYNDGEGNAEEVRMKLSGIAGALQFTNTELRIGVKWVPYVSAIQDNTMVNSEQFEYTVTGTLPEGLRITPAGEIYGVPQEAGEFPLHVTLKYTGSLSDMFSDSVLSLMTDKERRQLEKQLTCEGDLTLTILDNTDEYVWTTPSDQSYGYSVQTPVGTTTGDYHYVLDAYEDRIFKSEGPFGEFADFYLDGQKLTRDTDYTAESGSTVITVMAQTFERAGSGTHTIAAEFFRDSDDVRSMKTSSQNYTVSISSSDDNSDDDPSSGSDDNSDDSSSSSSDDNSGGGSGSGSGGSSEPVNPKPEPTGPVTEETRLPFVDVPEGHMFQAGIRWTYEHGLMIGTSDTTFQPDDVLTPGAIVTVLARLANVDLDQYKDGQDAEIPADTWYTAPAVWASQSSLLPSKGTAVFQSEVLTREEIAVMLIKYLRMLNVDTTIPEDGEIFTDADQMTPEGIAAFQLLYRYGVFAGVGNNAMDPGGRVDRGQFATLIYRVSGVIDAGQET